MSATPDFFLNTQKCLNFRFILNLLKTLFIKFLSKLLIINFKRLCKMNFNCMLTKSKCSMSTPILLHILIKISILFVLMYFRPTNNNILHLFFFIFMRLTIFRVFCNAEIIFMTALVSLKSFHTEDDEKFCLICCFVFLRLFCWRYYIMHFLVLS